MKSVSTDICMEMAEPAARYCSCYFMISVGTPDDCSSSSSSNAALHMVTREKNRSSEDVLKEQANILDNIERSRNDKYERACSTLSPKNSPKRSRHHHTTTSTYRAERASVSIYDTDGPKDGSRDEHRTLSPDSAATMKIRGHARDGSSGSSKSQELLNQPFDTFSHKGNSVALHIYILTGYYVDPFSHIEISKSVQFNPLN